MTRGFLLVVAVAGVACATEVPLAEIANSQIHARVYLPDAVNGYYRGTRFDWSGAVANLQWNGHEYFGKWFDRYDPKIHDAITGPVEEFLTRDKGLGYEDAKPGETFVKIGVGSIRKPAEPAFRQFATYEIADNGKWTVRKGKDWVEFTQTLKDPSGYAYVYTKRLSLTKGKPQMVLEHRLRNTGSKVIQSSVYEHNFYMLDGKSSGPNFTVTLPFTPKPTRGFNGFAEVRGNQIAYLRELKPGESFQSELKGFGASPNDYDIRVENRESGAGVRQTSNPRPISRFNFWSIRTTVCPEAYIDMNIEPGKEFTWNIVYDFYTVAQR